MFAFALSPEGIAEMAVKCLAVAGAFLVGYAVVGVGVHLLDRWLRGGKSNRTLKRAVRTLGGFAAAVAAAMFLFGSGGEGLFGGTGDGTNTAQGISTPATPTPAPPPPVPTQIVPKDLPPTDSIVRVTVLGGADVKEGRFYQVDSDATPLTLDDAKKVLLARKPADTTKLTLVIQFPERNAPAHDHAAVLDLQRWARLAGLGVYQPPTPMK